MHNPNQPPPSQPRPWMRVKDAAAYAAVSTSTIHKWLRRGNLYYGRQGNVIVVKAAEIDELLYRGRYGLE